MRKGLTMTIGVVVSIIIALLVLIVLLFFVPPFIFMANGTTNSSGNLFNMWPF